MSQENVERVRRSLDAINARDLDAFLALTGDEVAAVTRLVSIEGVYRGHEGIRRWWHNLFEIWPDFNLEIVEMGTVGELTIGTLQLHGRGVGSGIHSDWEVCSVARWESGKCVWWGTFETRAEALEAAALTEE